MFRLFAGHMYFALTTQIQKSTGFKKSAFLPCLDDLQIKCIFHKQPGSGIKLKAGSGSEKKLIII
jgi:hypothetical protein